MVPDQVLADRRGITISQLVEIRVKHGVAPFQEFDIQRHNAARRGIEWRLTFEEWWSIWSASGKYGQRGSKRGQFVMARNWDTGPYAVGNVEIQTTRENNETYWTRRRMRRKPRNGGRHGPILAPHVPDFTDDLDDLR